VTRYIVTGHYCPQDANPEKDARPTTVEIGCRNMDEVRDALLHVVDGKVKKVA
jgi:hypothetical protein